MSHENNAMELKLQNKVCRLTWAGFTSNHNLHRHYMKHVARLNGVKEKKEKDDPERWHEIWPDSPVLHRNLEARQKNLLKKLKSTLPKCGLSRKAPTKNDECKECGSDRDNAKKILAVGSAFKSELDTYNDIVQNSVLSVLKGEYPGGKPCFFVKREPCSDDCSLVVLSEKRVFVAALIDEKKGVLRAKTGYRPICGGRLKSFREAVFDFHTKRMAAKAAGLIMESSET